MSFLSEWENDIRLWFITGGQGFVLCPKVREFLLAFVSLAGQDSIKYVGQISNLSFDKVNLDGHPMTGWKTVLCTALAKILELARQIKNLSYLT
jgi:hypothetical protein